MKKIFRKFNFYYIIFVKIDDDRPFYRVYFTEHFDGLTYSFH